MLFELISTVIAGIAGAGFMMLLNRTFRGRFPRWLIPAAAGCAMVAATISNEYGWYDRTVANFPDRLAVAETVENKAFFRPWTYVKPFVDRFMAVDLDSVTPIAGTQGVVAVDLLLFGRWQQAQKVQAVFDCANHRQSQRPADMTVTAEGELPGAIWHPIEADKPVMGLVCGGA